MENKKSEYDRLKLLIGKCFEGILKWTETEKDIPGQSFYSGYAFKIPGGNNKGCVRLINPSETDRRLEISVFIGDTDYTVSSFTSKCNSIEEMRMYLKDESNIDEIADTIVDLNESADSKSHEYPFWS